MCEDLRRDVRIGRCAKRCANRVMCEEMGEDVRSDVRRCAKICAKMRGAQLEATAIRNARNSNECWVAFELTHLHLSCRRHFCFRILLLIIRDIMFMMFSLLLINKTSV